MRKNQGKGGKAYSNDYPKKPKPEQSQGSPIKVEVIAPTTTPRATSASTGPAASPAQPAAENGAQTMQQQRAKHALEQVTRTLEPMSDKDKKEFKSYASSLPAMIQMNGLGQAAAFYFSQGKIYKKLYDILSHWLTQPGQPYAGSGDLLAGITQQEMGPYFVAQAEALLLLDWVKKFAKAYVRED